MSTEHLPSETDLVMGTGNDALSGKRVAAQGGPRPFDTPKTDAAVYYPFDPPSAAVVSADFARGMERDLNEALLIIRDYFYVETRKQGRKMDQRANAFLIKMGAS